MAQITKRGKKWRVTVSTSKHGNNARITKSFDDKEDAKKWALENELAKNIGIDLYKRNQTFANYFENWVKTVKKMMSEKQLIRIISTLSQSLSDYFLTQKFLNLMICSFNLKLMNMQKIILVKQHKKSC
ncbi:hypothetical protein RyT2_01890 [Pseudolactococcus yaeyamensis]